MELSEAKNILKDMKESMEQSKKDITIDSILKALEDSVKAIDTVLKALDNSISKEYYEMTIKEQNDIIEDLKSKLDNSISKDEVRKKIEECVKRRQELANGHFWESPSNINEDTALVMAQTLYQELLGE